MPTADLAAIAPELYLGLTLVLVLLLDLLFRPSERKLTAWMAMAGLAVAFGALWRDRGLVQAGAFSGMIAVDPLANFFKMIFLAATAGTVFLAYRSKEIAAARHGEFHILLLAAALGMCFMAGASDLVMVYLSVEMLSQSSYILAGYTRGSPRSSEAALKYVLYGGVASGTMIFGISLLYGLTGATDLSIIGQELAARPVTDAAYLAFALVLVGLAFKVSAAPFHMWTPDVYEGAPTPVTAFLAIGSKAAGFAILIRFLLSAMSQSSGGGAARVWDNIPAVDWKAVLAVLAVLTMTIGNLSAIGQKSLKRLLAFSGVAHAGYLLAGCVAATVDGLSAVLFYLSVYLVMNLGAFAVVILVSNATGRDDDRDYAGLGWKHPFLAAVMSVFLVSLVGLPPTAGFLGKWYLFSALVKIGSWPYLLLALAALLNSVVSLYYYAYIIKRMWLEEPKNAAPIRSGWVWGAALAGMGILTLYPFGYASAALSRAIQAALHVAP